MKQKKSARLFKRKKKALVGWGHFRKNFTNGKYELVKMLNPEGGWALFHKKETAYLSKYMSQALTGRAVKDKITKVRITIEEAGR